MHVRRVPIVPHHLAYSLVVFSIALVITVARKVFCLLKMILRQYYDILLSWSTQRYQKRARKSQDKMVAKFNKTHKLVDYPNGTMVMARDERREGTTGPKFEGPFMVGDRYHENSYTLLDGTGSPLTRRYASSQLKYYQQRSSQFPAVSEEKSSDSDATSESYEVEAILDHAQGENLHMYHYYVRWKGYGPEHNSWIPFTNFDDIRILSNYWRQQRKQLFPPYALDNVSNKEKDSNKNKGTLNKTKRLTTGGTNPAQTTSSSQNKTCEDQNATDLNFVINYF